MKMYLVKEELWSSVEGTVQDQLDAREILNRNQKSLSLIVLMVDNDQLVLLKNAISGRQAWNILREHHVQNTVSSKIRLMKKVFKMELARGGDMISHLQKIFELFGKLTDRDCDLHEDAKISVILASLNEEYEPLITAIEAWSPEYLTLSAVKAKLLIKKASWKF